MHPFPVVRSVATPDETSLIVAGIEAQLAKLEELTLAARKALGELRSADIEGIPSANPGAHTVPRWHFPMLNDHERNNAFVAVLERLITPESHVLDIGTGTGVLAMAAARAGAAHVTTCEANPLLAELARQIINSHGFSDRITVISGHSSLLRVGRDIPRPADVLVSEIFDCGLIGEGVLSTIRHARRELIHHDGIIVPRQGVLLGQFVESEPMWRLNHADTAGGFDISLVNSLATVGHFPVRLNTWPHRMLSGVAELLSIDFTGFISDEYRRQIVCTATQAGTVHGLVAWFELDLGHGQKLRNSPGNLVSHWMQAFLPLSEPMRVDAGEALQIDLRCAHDTLYATAQRAEPPVGQPEAPEFSSIGATI